MFCDVKVLIVYTVIFTQLVIRVNTYAVPKREEPTWKMNWPRPRTSDAYMRQTLGHHLYLVNIPNYDILLGYFRLCYLLSLRYLDQ